MDEHGEIEQVLVVPRSIFAEVGVFQGITTQLAPYLTRFFEPGSNLFLPRPEAEEDPDYKQLIPYAVFCHGDEVLHYVRGGGSGEKRLVAKGSVGVGGHINNNDCSTGGFDEESYHRAVRREIREELKIDGSWREEIAALLNDDSVEVGRVHLGVVHIVQLESKQVVAAEEALSQLTFRKPADLLKKPEELETWSRIVLENWEALKLQA